MSETFDPYYTWLGIPPHEQPANHYRLLGISPFESNAEVISNAADGVMLHLRAFQTGQRGKESQQLLNEVAAARVTLHDPEKKAAYDAQLQARLAPAAPPIVTPASEILERPVDPAAAAPYAFAIQRQPGACTIARASTRPAARRRKPTPAIIIVALVAAALFALGGGIAFLVFRISGFHSGRNAQPVPAVQRAASPITTHHSRRPT